MSLGEVGYHVLTLQIELHNAHEKHVVKYPFFHKINVNTLRLKHKIDIRDLINTPNESLCPERKPKAEKVLENCSAQVTLVENGNTTDIL